MPIKSAANLCFSLARYLYSICVEQYISWYRLLLAGYQQVVDPGWIDPSYRQACSLIYRQSAKLAQSNRLGLGRVLSKLSYTAVLTASASLFFNPLGRPLLRFSTGYILVAALAFCLRFGYKAGVSRLRYSSSSCQQFLSSILYFYLLYLFSQPSYLIRYCGCLAQSQWVIIASTSQLPFLSSSTTRG